MTPNAGGGLFAFTAQAAGEWFGPGQSLPPMAQDAAIGRAFDYPAGYNLRTRPKSGEGIGFSELRALADGYDLLRLVIETRKDQIEKLAWDIKPRLARGKAAQDPDKRIQSIKDFLQSPDQESTFFQWLRQILEDLFVLDAPAVYVRRTKGGRLYALEPIDGATIRRVLDDTGRTPLEGSAYQQVLKGVPAADYSRGELLYMPRNRRTHRVYGYSPVEQVITTVNIAIRRQLHQLSYYTEGNTPNLIFGVPREWTTEQIRQFQAWWDSLMTGNAAARARARFVPGEVKPLDTKEQALKDEYDEWLARIICYAFSVSAQPFVKQMNRSTAETADQQAREEGLAPVQNWIKAFMDRVLRDCFEAGDLEFVWSMERSLEPLERAQIDATDIASGVRTVNECRENRGLEPLSDGELEALKPPVPPPTNNQPIEPGKSATPETDGPDSETKPAADATPVQKCSCCAPATESETALSKAAKKGIKPINRNRKSVQKLHKQLGKTVSKFFKAQVRPLAEAVHAGIGKVAKPSLFTRAFSSREKLQKMTRDEAKRILDAVGMDWTELGDDLDPVLSAIAQDGAGAAFAQIGKSAEDLFDQVNEKAVAWAEEHAAALVTQIAETTREKIAGDVADAIEQGLSVDELADVLAGAYAFSEERAEIIATTELAFADVRGNCIAYAESGVVGGLTWITANGGEDGRICSDCEMNDNQTVPMGPDGMPTEAWPSGTEAPPPLHPGCLCDCLPDLIPTEE